MLRLMLLGSIFLIVVSCSGFYSPHENFKEIIGHNVGRSADDPRTLVVRYPELYADNKILSNGNTENRYQWIRSCSYFLEIDKETNVIVSWRFEGSEDDCIIIP